MALAAVGQLGVDLIRQNDDVLVPQQLRDAVPGPPGASRPRWGCTGKGSIMSLVRGVMAASSSCAVSLKPFSAFSGSGTGTPPVRRGAWAS